tara:strand:- start:401 stop:508 length:108 start_codon:yes stop_codon:yes gene_type:complete
MEKLNELKEKFMAMDIKKKIILGVIALVIIVAILS